VPLLHASSAPLRCWCFIASALIFFFLTPPPPTSTLFPYTTLFRSCRCALHGAPGHFRHELLNAVTVKDTTGRIELLRDGFVHLGGYATAAGHRDTPDIGRRQSRHHVAGSLLQRGLFPVNRTGNAVRDSASEPDNGGQLLLQTSEQTSHDRLTSRY